MRLKYLKIEGFKNLNTFELNFEGKDGLTVLIGNNGSGKSNILEAISEIFAKLFMAKTTSYRMFNKSIPSFYFEIEYILNDKNIKIDFLEEHNEYRFTIDGELASRTNILTHKNNYLPSQLIANYSGEEGRLYDKYYSYFYIAYIKALKNNQLAFYPKQELLYINGDYWSISFLTMLFSQLSNVHDFIRDFLNVITINEVEIILKKPTWARGDVFTSENKANNKVIRFLYELYSLRDSETIIRESKIISFKINHDIIDKLQSIQSIGSEKDFYISMAAAYFSDLVESINITYNGSLNIGSMSEGQKKLILTKAILEFLSDENALVLLDEPDSHIHVANKKKFKDLLLSYENRENIITTHSPTLTHSFDDKHITMINQGQVEDKQKQEIFSQITDGIWNYQEQSIFLSSTKNIILLVEGKHDKIHIEEAFKRLNSGYEELNFDIFQMNGEANIKHMMLGLANNGVNFNGKKIIAIFDNDKAGQDSFSKNFKKIENKVFKHLVDNDGNPSDTFYGFLLPKTQSFPSDFTIENMYNGEKYKNALSIVFSNRNDNDFFNNFVDEISKQIKEDAKNQLADNCKKFNDDDFSHFRELFNLIKDIKSFSFSGTVAL